MNLDELQKIAERATPGTWTISPSEEEVGQYHLAEAFNTSDDEEIANAEHISAFNPQTALKLIADLRKATLELQWVHKFFSETLPKDIEESEPEYQMMMSIRRLLSSLQSDGGG